MRVVEEEVQKTPLNFLGLLSEDTFQEALALYVDENDAVKRMHLENYLTRLSTKNPTLALKYMQMFLEEESNAKIVKLMIETYINKGSFEKAIALLLQAKEDYVSDDEDKRLGARLKEIAIKNIESYTSQKQYIQLQTFLEQMIDYDDSEGFYKLSLAELYMKLEKDEETREVLSSLEYDETYGLKAKKLLEGLDEEDEEYEYAIALRQHGSHFVVHVFLDGREFRLMLDTGASFTLLDEAKVSSLEVVRENLVLQTAGNNISAKLANIGTMEMGEIKISNFKVTVASFPRNNIDGLLGMNFFKRFKFFIDQEKSILYLDRK